MDVHRILRLEYQYSYASSQTLNEIEQLIKISGVKHLTGVKDPGPKTLKKIKLNKDSIPIREVEFDE